MFKNNASVSFYMGPTTSSVVDESVGGRTARTITNIGTVAVSTGQTCPGGRAMAFDGSTQCLQASNAASLSFGAEDFFIGFYAYFTSAPSAAATLAKGTASSPNRSWIIANNCQLFISADGTNWISTGFSGLYSALTTWNYYAYSRKGSTWTQFKDGVPSGSAYSGSHTLNTNSDQMGVASYGDGSARSGVRMSNILVVKGWGISRAFTPPNRLL